ncbi:hypothetical protein [Microbispora sp. NPDC046933]|uniref:hypothetical protein n=1 Tax=Microbispora sp. NPDC046933 TaxID=3155618 RepID=UPI0033CEAB2A
MTGEPADLREAATRGRRVVLRLLGTATTFVATDEIMALSRDEQMVAKRLSSGGIALFQTEDQLDPLGDSGRFAGSEQP